MLGLKLREEFLGAQMPGTAITLRTNDKRGAADRSAEEILSITYPTADVQTALRAISTKKNGSPIVLLGDRGRGKSHIMAVMHHAVASPLVVENWLEEWGDRLDSSELAALEIAKGYVPISEPVHNHEYPLLWNLLFDRHPKGEYFRGQFEGKQQPFPPRSLLEKMFEEQPVCLILDEFQKWFDGLHNESGDGVKYQTWAENYIQILSEIAKDRPEILILAVSVLNNRTDAFQQVHRQGPVIVDFRGPSAKEDRQKLLLHRLFENRRNISEAEIMSLTDVYGSERFRLLHANKSEAEKGRIRQEVSVCWPFSPELLDTIEDHILLSSAAQETRDLIRILAQVYRSRGDTVPVVTPADFFVDGESDEVQTLVDSIVVQAGQEKLRQIAQRNLEAVHDSGVDVPHARELISTIWMRSMSPGRTAGGTPAELHLDITRSTAIDDNAFEAELCLLIENSVNIHGDGVPGGPLWFGINENPRSKVRACAKNNKLWHPAPVPPAGLTVYPGKDIAHIRNTLLHIFVSEATQPPSRVVILGPSWRDDPWKEVDEGDKPGKWDRPVLLVVPDQIGSTETEVSPVLGVWLATHVPKRRNTVRFLLLANDAKGLYGDEELLFTARCSFLCSPEGWGSDLTYRTLHKDFDRPLRQALGSRFNRFAVLRKWDFQSPQNCIFEIEKPKINKQGEDVLAQGDEIPKGVEGTIFRSVFDQTTFKDFVLQRAKDSDFVGYLMDDLIEPPPPDGGEAIPFLGETKMYEAVLTIAAGGDLALNVNGTWIARRPEDTTDDDALRHIRSKAYRMGQEMRQVLLGLPGAVGGGAVTVSKVPQPGVEKTGTSDKTPHPDAESKEGAGQTTSSGDKPADDAGSSGEEPTPATEAVAKSRKSEKAASGINLSGCFETWGVASGKSIETARIQFDGLTVQQIKQILQRIPSAYKATLEISYTEDEEQ